MGRSVLTLPPVIELSPVSTSVTLQGSTCFWCTSMVFRSISSVTSLHMEEVVGEVLFYDVAFVTQADDEVIIRNENRSS